MSKNQLWTLTVTDEETGLTIIEEEHENRNVLIDRARDYFKSIEDEHQRKLESVAEELQAAKNDDNSKKEEAMKNAISIFPDYTTLDDFYQDLERADMEEREKRNLYDETIDRMIQFLRGYNTSESIILSRLSEDNNLRVNTAKYNLKLTRTKKSWLKQRKSVEKGIARGKTNAPIWERKSERSEREQNPEKRKSIYAPKKGYQSRTGSFKPAKSDAGIYGAWKGAEDEGAYYDEEEEQIGYDEPNEWADETADWTRESRPKRQSKKDRDNEPEIIDEETEYYEKTLEQEVHREESWGRKGRAFSKAMHEEGEEPFEEFLNKAEGIENEEENLGFGERDTDVEATYDTWDDIVEKGDPSVAAAQTYFPIAEMGRNLMTGKQAPKSTLFELEIQQGKNPEWTVKEFIAKDLQLMTPEQIKEQNKVAEIFARMTGDNLTSGADAKLVPIDPKLRAELDQRLANGERFSEAEFKQYFEKIYPDTEIIAKVYQNLQDLKLFVPGVSVPEILSKLRPYKLYRLNEKGERVYMGTEAYKGMPPAKYPLYISIIGDDGNEVETLVKDFDFSLLYLKPSVKILTSDEWQQIVAKKDIGELRVDEKGHVLGREKLRVSKYNLFYSSPEINLVSGDKVEFSNVFYGSPLMSKGIFVGAYEFNGKTYLAIDAIGRRFSVQPRFVSKRLDDQRDKIPLPYYFGCRISFLSGSQMLTGSVIGFETATNMLLIRYMSDESGSFVEVAVNLQNSSLMKLELLSTPKAVTFVADFKRYVSGPPTLNQRRIVRVLLLNLFQLVFLERPLKFRVEKKEETSLKHVTIQWGDEGAPKTYSQAEIINLLDLLESKEKKTYRDIVKINLLKMASISQVGSVNYSDLFKLIISPAECIQLIEKQLNQNDVLRVKWYTNYVYSISEASQDKADKIREKFGMVGENKELPEDFNLLERPVGDTLRIELVGKIRAVLEAPLIKNQGGGGDTSIPLPLMDKEGPPLSLTAVIQSRFMLWFKRKYEPEMLIRLKDAFPEITGKIRDKITREVSASEMFTSYITTRRFFLNPKSTVRKVRDDLEKISTKFPLDVILLRRVVEFEKYVAKIPRLETLSNDEIIKYVHTLDPYEGKNLREIDTETERKKIIRELRNFIHFNIDCRTVLLSQAIGEHLMNNYEALLVKKNNKYYGLDIALKLGEAKTDEERGAILKGIADTGFTVFEWDILSSIFYSEIAAIYKNILFNEEEKIRKIFNEEELPNILGDYKQNVPVPKVMSPLQKLVKPLLYDEIKNGVDELESLVDALYGSGGRSALNKKEVQGISVAMNPSLLYFSKIAFLYSLLSSDENSPGKFLSVFKSKIRAGLVRIPDMIELLKNEVDSLPVMAPEIFANHVVLDNMTNLENVLEVLRDAKKYFLEDIVYETYLFEYRGTIEKFGKTFDLDRLWKNPTRTDGSFMNLGDCIMDPRQVCVTDYESVAHVRKMEIEDIPQAELTICYDPDLHIFTCHAISDIVEALHRGDEINPYTSKAYPEDFRKRVTEMFMPGGKPKDLSISDYDRLAIGAEEFCTNPSLFQEAFDDKFRKGYTKVFAEISKIHPGESDIKICKAIAKAKGDIKNALGYMT